MIAFFSPKFCHSTCPKLFRSHGFSSFFSLSVAYKIIVLAPCALSHYFQDLYNSLSNTQPAYLNLMLTPARNSRQLRSTSSNRLYIPWVKKKAGTRAFLVAAPTVWNSLPDSVKSECNIPGSLIPLASKNRSV